MRTLTITLDLTPDEERLIDMAFPTAKGGNASKAHGQHIGSIVRTLLVQRAASELRRVTDMAHQSRHPRTPKDREEVLAKINAKAAERARKARNGTQHA